MGGFANGIGNSVFTTLVNRGIVYYNEELKVRLGNDRQ